MLGAVLVGRQPGGDHRLREAARVRPAPQPRPGCLGAEQRRAHLELAAEHDRALVEVHPPRRVADHVVGVELLLEAEDRVPVDVGLEGRHAAKRTVPPCSYPSHQSMVRRQGPK